MDLIFGSPLGKLKTELQVHRIKGDWEVILHKLQIFEGNRGKNLMFHLYFVLHLRNVIVY